MAAKCFDRFSAESVIERDLKTASAAIETMGRKLTKEFSAQISKSIFDGLGYSAKQLDRIQAH
jgi:hypothetical protein